MLIHDLSLFSLFFTSIIVFVLLCKNFLSKNINCYYFIIFIILFFYCAPVFLDYIIGEGVLLPIDTRSVYDAMHDLNTKIFYNIYITAILIYFYFKLSSKKIKKYNLSYNDVQVFFNRLKNKSVFLYFLILMPVFLAFFSLDYEFYYNYVDRDRANAKILQIYASKLAIISIPIIVFLIIKHIDGFKRNPNVYHVFSILFISSVLFLNIYIHGKRSIVAAFIFLFITGLLLTKVLNKKTFFILTLIILCSFYFFIQGYGKNIEDAKSFLDMYNGLRVDFSRDYSLKFVIFHEIFNDNYVLPYLGASYLFLLSFYIPRDIWENKPVPYAVYFTNSVFGNFGDDYFYGWGLTTSFVSEAVSNLGILGLLFFPIIFSIIIDRVERLNSIFMKMLGYLIMVLLLVIQPMAIMVLIFVFLLLLTVSKLKFR